MPDDDWDDADDVADIADEMSLDSLDLLSEVTNEIRGSLLRRMARPITVAELAAQMDVPVTRLYHHVNRLETNGLISVVATRRVGGVVERRYRASARTYKVAPELVQSALGRDLAQVLGGLFDVAKLEMQVEIEAESLEADQMVLGLTELRLTPERFGELRARILELIDEFRADDGEDTEPVRLFTAAFPTRADQ